MTPLGDTGLFSQVLIVSTQKLSQALPAQQNQALKEQDQILSTPSRPRALPLATSIPGCFHGLAQVSFQSGIHGWLQLQQFPSLPLPVCIQHVCPSNRLHGLELCVSLTVHVPLLNGRAHTGRCFGLRYHHLHLKQCLASELCTIQLSLRF